MKKETKTPGKLSLNKQTITKLNPSQMNEVKAGTGDSSSDVCYALTYAIHTLIHSGRPCI